MRTTRRIHVGWTLAAAALASVATVLALPGGGGAVTGATPDNTGEPRISGSAVVGSTLSASQGSWTGSPTSYAYQWVRCGQDGGRPNGSDCAAVGGATTTRYVVATADVDHRLRVRVTASNADGSRTVASNATGLVRAADTGRPKNVQAPALSGSAAQGQTLHVDARHVERSPADHVHLPLAALRHRREQLHRPAGIPGRRLRPPRGRRRQDHPRPRDRAERAGRGQRAHGSEPGRAGPAGAVRRDHAAERREVDPGDERPLDREARRRPGAVLAEPDPLADRADHRAGQGEGHTGLRRPRRARVPPLHAARDAERAGSADGAGRVAAGDRHPGERLPGAPARVRRAVLREGVPPGRSPSSRGVAGYRLVQVPLG